MGRVGGRQSGSFLSVWLQYPDNYVGRGTWWIKHGHVDRIVGFMGLIRRMVRT